MTDIAIKVENLSKLYRIIARQKRHDTLRDRLTDIFTAPFKRSNKKDFSISPSLSALSPNPSALSSLLFAADAKKKDDPWVTMEERVKIWGEVVSKELGLSLPLPQPKPYTVSPNGLEATFEKDDVKKWTIINAT